MPELGKERAMNAKKILYPTDLSELSRTALDYAAALAQESDGELLVVHVQEPGGAYVFGDSFFSGATDVDTGALRKALEAVRPENAAIRCRHRLLTGNPADQIVSLAEREKVDVIVMATHGRTGLMHLLMGSVAEAVIRRAHCPVLSFKPEFQGTAQAARV